jgi:cytidylate kinase
MLICVAGYPGTETKNVCKNLALQMGLRYLDEESIMKKVGRIQMSHGEENKDVELLKSVQHVVKNASKHDHIVTDHALAAWGIKDADLRIFIHSSEKVRAAKLARREKLTLTAAQKKLADEEEAMRKKFLNAYSINLDDLSAFDLVINVDKLRDEGIVSVVRKYLHNMANAGDQKWQQLKLAGYA